MKELSIEEKAKAYDEALERARNLHKDAVEMENNMTTKICEIIFPELKESEDEKIRKRIIQALHGDVLDMEETTKAIAWLEKQGNNINCIYDKELSELLHIVICRYINDPDISYPERENVSKKILPYVELLEKQGQHAKFINNIQIGDQVTRNQDGMLINLSQLKRVAKPSEKSCESIGDTDIVDSNENGLIAATISSKSSEWSEEDEKMFNKIAAHLSATCSGFPEDEKWASKFLNWFETLKERVQPQPKQEWSEEDKKALKVVTDIFEQYGVHLLNYPAFIHWLKTLPNRITFNPYWKPTEEQIKALHDLNLTGGISYAGQGQTLIELYNNLNKL